MTLRNILDAGFVTALCFLFSFYISYFLDKLIPKLDTRKSKPRLTVEVTCAFFVIGVVIYLAQQYIPQIEVFGKHSEQVKNLPIFVFIFMFFQKNLQNTINYLISTI